MGMKMVGGPKEPSICDLGPSETSRAKRKALDGEDREQRANPKKKNSQPATRNGNVPLQILGITPRQGAKTKRSKKRKNRIENSRERRGGGIV